MGKSGKVATMLKRLAYGLSCGKAYFKEICNSRRAELIQEEALKKALRVGNPGFAAFDAYEKAPVYDVNYPLLQLYNIIVTLHLVYV